jgi:hypothetical protein
MNDYPREKPALTLHPDEWDVARFISAGRSLAIDALDNAWKQRYRHPLRARRSYKRFEALMWLIFPQDGSEAMRLWRRRELRLARDVAAHLDRFDDDGLSDWEALVEIIDAKLSAPR